jgi:hypothetical protein
MFFPLSIVAFKSYVSWSVASMARGRHLPYTTFIATPLLPSGRLNAPIQKFTGNGEIGTADDDLTKAIHAFVHFALVYTRKSFLLCDLQGWSKLCNTLFCLLIIIVKVCLTGLGQCVL